MDNRREDPEDPEDPIKAYRKSRRDYGTLAGLTARFLEFKVRNKSKDKGEIWPMLFATQSRAKSVDSVEKKILGKEGLKTKEFLNTVRDLAGVRVIFYFRDDLVEFCDRAQFSDWFGLEAKDSLRAYLAPESLEFGYDSYHLQFRVLEGSQFYRALRADHKRKLHGKWCEVQLRTVLQHAWAETEHDLLYKTPESHQLSENNRVHAEREWRILAATLELLDNQIVERKAFLKSHFAQLGKTTAFTTWTNPLPDRHENNKLLKHNGVSYGYVIEHCGDQPYPKVYSNPTLYDVDNVFREPRFKQRIWDSIERKDPDFVDNLLGHDASMVRVCNWDEARNCLDIQPAHYSDQIVTNQRKAHEYTTASGRTVLDEAFDESGTLLPLGDSPLSNTLGVSCVIRTTDGRWVIARRSAKLAVDAGRWSCSASGAVGWGSRPFNETGDDMDLIGLVFPSLATRCKRELGFVLKREWLAYLAFARELDRAGKPQVFLLVDMKGREGDGLSANELEAAWNMYAIDTDVTELKFLRDDGAARELVGVDKTKISEIIGGTDLAEELRANLMLALRFLEPPPGL